MAPTTPTFRFVTPAEAPEILSGTIMFLPPHDKLPQNTFTDPELLAGAYNHPVVVISCPSTKTIRHDSKVEIAIMTSFNSTPIRTHLRQSRNQAFSSGSIAAQKSGYLRVVTASKPYAHDTLKLRNGKGMKRDCSYVGVRNTYMVGLGGLARYGGKGSEVGEYKLTAHALKVLVGRVEEERGRRGRWEKKAGKEEKGKGKLGEGGNVVKGKEMKEKVKKVKKVKKAKVRGQKISERRMSLRSFTIN
ncbi:hypothetical protein B0J14DRAFT_645313 [Halenospora varia]|nr:hypothetical protein B0J14DRAFT_645313 [Halenospora varia]